jgi:hypothetical protein
MSVAEAQPAKLRIARVVQLTGQVIARNLGLFGILSLLINTPLVILVFTVLQPGFQAGDFSFTNLAPVMAGLLVFLVGYVVLQAAIIYITVRDLNGQRPPLGESLAVGFREFFPLIAISLLYTLGIVVGMLLLIVPGFILLCSWSVTTPVRVVERLGILDCFGRSYALTKGSRGKIFGLFVIYVVIEIVIALIITAFTGTAGAEAAADDPLSTASLIAAGGEIVSNTISSVILTAAVAALYYELRVLKEGIGPEALASVFD